MSKLISKTLDETATEPPYVDPAVEAVREAETAAKHAASKDLKRKTATGALVSTISQVVTLIVRAGSIPVLARLVTPKDYGLVGMVVAVTGFLGLFRDAGLSMATVQRESVTDEQTSTLFWINLAVGGALAGICAVLAPAQMRSVRLVLSGA